MGRGHYFITRHVDITNRSNWQKPSKVVRVPHMLTTAIIPLLVVRAARLVTSLVGSGAMVGF